MVLLPPPREDVPTPDAPGRVVVVDDEPQIVEVLSRILRRRGYSVVSHHDARDALAALTDETPDVIVCDLMMPHLTGQELYEAVARLRPDLAARFVFMTAGATRDDLLAFATEPGRTCLDKPLDFVKLFAALRDAQARRHASR